VKIFKEKYVGSIMKLYNTSNQTNLDINVFILCLDIIKTYINEIPHAHGIHLNFRNNGWNMDKLLSHLQKANEKIDALDACYDGKTYKEASLKELFGPPENGSGIIYGVNKTIDKRRRDFVELAINFNNWLAEKVDIINIVKKISEKMDIDYGYVFYLKKGYDWLSENKFKIGFFSYTVTTPKGFLKERDKLLEVNNGYIPKIHKYNILNIEQQKTLNKNNLVKINNRVSLYEE
jgi:hypothetical protein